MNERVGRLCVDYRTVEKHVSVPRESCYSALCPFCARYTMHLRDRDGTMAFTGAYYEIRAVSAISDINFCHLIRGVQLFSMYSPKLLKSVNNFNH